MTNFDIITVLAGIFSMTAGIYMMRKNMRARLAFFIELAGLLLLISSLGDDNNTLHNLLSSYLNMFN